MLVLKLSVVENDSYLKCYSKIPAKKKVTSWKQIVRKHCFPHPPTIYSCVISVLSLIICQQPYSKCIPDSLELRTSQSYLVSGCCQS